MSNLNIFLKLKYSFYSALVFFLVANPEAYKLTQLTLGNLLSIASPSGCPTTGGFILHTVLFFVAIAALMMIPRER